MKQVEKKYQCIPFWSWNDELDEEGLVKQIEWMNKNGVGGLSAPVFLPPGGTGASVS